jgi:hypothetical protein
MIYGLFAILSLSKQLLLFHNGHSGIILGQDCKRNVSVTIVFLCFVLLTMTTIEDVITDERRMVRVDRTALRGHKEMSIQGSIVLQSLIKHKT